MAIEEKTGDDILKEKFSPIFMRYVPKEVAKDFREFAVMNAGNNYGVALRMLLDSLKHYTRLVEIETQLSELSLKVQNLENKPETEQRNRKVPKTFGGNRNE